MLYHSKKPTIHYLFPGGYIFPKGDFEIYSVKGEKILVEQEAIQSFKISNVEAMSLLQEEIKEQVTSFMRGVKKMTNSASREEEKPIEENIPGAKEAVEKISKGIEFLKLSAKTMSLFWKINTSNDKDELFKYRKEMLEIKNDFKEKGYEVSDDFEELPFKLKEKYKKEGKLDNFQKAAEEFKKALLDLKL